MPYYCTVPRCTSMAGKAKNVSFHQFPKNEELADLWNNILKRGKPYTKYSKVCSLHFKAEDYTITSMGKNKGQWRSLRKDAVPSRNLPDEAPPQQVYRRRSSTPASLPSPNLMDPKVQQQVAQAIYMQTMLAMQAASFGGSDQQRSIDLSLKQNDDRDDDDPESNDDSDEENPVTTTHSQPVQPQTSSSSNTSELQRFLLKYSASASAPDVNQSTHLPTNSFKCNVCSKFFKDPDVLLIHQRSHRQPNLTPSVQKENVSYNSDTLRANPILANLLRPDDKSDCEINLDRMNSAMALNMEAYIKSITASCNRDSDSDSLNESKSPKLVIDESVNKSWL